VTPLERLDFFQRQGRVELVAVAPAAEDLESGIQLTQAVKFAINGFQSRYSVTSRESTRDEDTG
jgi:hypothetical protein